MKKRALNIWLPAAAVTALYILYTIIVHKGFYYYVNDDLIIRDILSGRYSGVPDAHVYNIIYPFAWVIKTLYQLFPTVDFWGLLMIGLPFSCLYAVLTRVFSLKMLLPFKASLCLLTVLAFHFMCSMGILFFTFTYTAALCAATALLLFVTCDHEGKPFTQYIPSLVFMLFSFCLRKDTLLMALPLFAAWGAFLLLRSKKPVQTLLHLLKPIGALALCAAVLFGSHILAFSSPEWQDFLEFRDLRKSVHDFGFYPPYDSAKVMYDSIDLSREEKNLVAIGMQSGINTVFDTDPDIRTILARVHRYNEGHRKQISFRRLSIEANDRILQYYKRPLTGALTLMNGIAFLLIVGYALYKKKWWLAVCTTLGIVFIVAEIYGLSFMGRMTLPVLRASLALGLMWLLGIVLYLLRKDATNKLWSIWVLPLFLCLSVLLTVGCASAHKSIENNTASYQTSAENTRALREYCKSHSENIYFQPALIIVNHTDNMSMSFDSEFNNLVILGGWNAFSPEYTQSLQTFGLGNLSIEQTLLQKDNAYIIASEPYTVAIVQYLEWKYGDRFSYTANPIPEFADTGNSNLLLYDFNLAD